MTSIYTIYISILILIFIFLVVLFYFYVKKDGKNNHILGIVGNKDNDRGNGRGDDGSIENIHFNRSNKSSLKEILKELKISEKNPISFKGNVIYTTFTQSTTDDKLRLTLDDISKYILVLLNAKNKNLFVKTNYGDVEIWTDIHNNENIVYELFVWDKIHYFQTKLRVNVIKFIDKKYAVPYGVELSSYMFPYYNIGQPFYDQLIPPPEEVIATGHFALSSLVIDRKTPNPIKYLYINNIQIENSTLIVDYFKKKSELDCQGISDISLEYVQVKGDTDPYFKKGREYNKWDTLYEEPLWKGQYPSKTPPKIWDCDGIYYYEDKNKGYDVDKCKEYQPGTIWSDMKEPLQPYYWPTLATIPEKCGMNNWLFENVNGVEGTFYGGGKR